MAQQGLGIKVPTAKQIAGKRYGEKKQIQKSITREKKPRGLIEQVTRGFKKGGLVRSPRERLLQRRDSHATRQ
jgi:hypothetical protein